MQLRVQSSIVIFTQIVSLIIPALVMETLKGTSVFSRLTTVVLVLRSDNVNENKIYKSNSEATAVTLGVLKTRCIAVH